MLLLLSSRHKIGGSGGIAWIVKGPSAIQFLRIYGVRSNDRDSSEWAELTVHDCYKATPVVKSAIGVGASVDVQRQEKAG